MKSLRIESRLTKISNWYSKPNRTGDYCLAQCSCGKATEVRRKNLHTNTKSCGCLKKEKEQDPTTKIKHGWSRHPLYNVYLGIIARCYEEADFSYHNYGGRGITVCDEWLTSIEQFIKWALGNGWEKGLQIDRRENNGPYSPENCRIATATENCRNTRSNRYITINGATKCMSEWCELYNNNYRTVSNRINRMKWDPIRAITTKTKTPYAGTR